MIWRLVLEVTVDTTLSQTNLGGTMWFVIGGFAAFIFSLLFWIIGGLMPPREGAQAI